jgi:hypothetical protein
VFIDVPSQQPDDQLQKQHKIQTEITDNGTHLKQTHTKQITEYLIMNCQLLWTVSELRSRSISYEPAILTL